MDRSSADAFVYAKASGVLAKSFVGPRAASLFAVNSLHELWSLVFQTEVPVIPEMLLAEKIEQEAEAAFLNDYISLLNNYSRPQSLLVNLLRFYDYDNLKDIGASLCTANLTGEIPVLPHLAKIGQYSMLNYEAWPDLKLITSGSTVEWYNNIPDFSKQQELDTKLDLQHIRELWDSALHLKGGARQPVLDLLQEEIVMHNIVWALRLRVYYDMDAEEIYPSFVTVKPLENLREIKKDPLAGPAVKILSLPTDSYAEWSTWKYASLLNPNEEGVVWNVDPRWIQQAAKVAIQKKALRQFHRYPFTPHVLFCWFKIKQYELDCIRTVAEGLRLEVSTEQAKDFAGIVS